MRWLKRALGGSDRARERRPRSWPGSGARLIDMPLRDSRRGRGQRPEVLLGRVWLMPEGVCFAGALRRATTAFGHGGVLKATCESRPRLPSESRLRRG